MLRSKGDGNVSEERGNTAAAVDPKRPVLYLSESITSLYYGKGIRMYNNPPPRPKQDKNLGHKEEDENKKGMKKCCLVTSERFLFPRKNALPEKKEQK